METKLNVKLMAHTPEPEKLVAAAAKLCYSQAGASEIMEDLTNANVERFLSGLMAISHFSPIEHVSFTFAIEGVSRALTHQLVRHRIANYSQKSQRYVSEMDFDYIIPDVIKNNFYARETYEKIMVNAQTGYNSLFGILKLVGLNEKEAYENARYVLPNACETKIVVTMNVRTLLHFFNQRCCSRAQTEIREMADEMLRLCKEVAPMLFKNGGAPCVNGKCPEGSMSCGGVE